MVLVLEMGTIVTRITNDSTHGGNWKILNPTLAASRGSGEKPFSP